MQQNHSKPVLSTYQKTISRYNLDDFNYFSQRIHCAYYETSQMLKKHIYLQLTKETYKVNDQVGKTDSFFSNEYLLTGR